MAGDALYFFEGFNLFKSCTPLLHSKQIYSQYVYVATCSVTLRCVVKLLVNAVVCKMLKCCDVGRFY